MIKLRSLLVAFSIIILGLATTSCFNNNDEPATGTPVDPALTGLCNNTWVMDSVANQIINAYQYETYRFNTDGTGIHTGYNQNTNDISTIKFTWKPFEYNGMNYLEVYFDGYTYAAQMYYAVVNGAVRLAGNGYYYEMIPKVVSDEVLSNKIEGVKWELTDVDDVSITPQMYEAYEFNGDGTGIHTRFNTSTSANVPADITWAVYSVTGKFGVVSIKELNDTKFYTCQFNQDGTLSLIAPSPKQVKTFKQN